MKLTTDLTQSPYFNDYDEEKNFHQILFKPSVPVQARELNQLHTILQEQVNRFGDNIIREGSIVKGGNFVDIKRIHYIKILDNNINNQPISISNYIGTVATGQTTGIKARVITGLEGLESQTPDLNTLYLKYVNTAQDGANNDIKEFLPGEILNFTLDGVAQNDLTISIATSSIDSAPVGRGYAIRCGDGIIFQKGHFIRFEDQVAVVSKYTTWPDEVVVGFQTKEEIINSNSDTSLLDNAAGFNNESAPGADRLKLTPILTVLTKEEADADESFLAIQEYQRGRVIRRNDTTQYNEINNYIEQRTFEESGNYSLGDVNMFVGYKYYANNDVDPNYLSVYIDPTVLYVEGKRVEIFDRTAIDIEKATDYASITDQDVLCNYGSYIVIDSLRGQINFNNFATIDLYDAAQTSNTVGIGFSSVGSKIGEASVISQTYHDTGEYRLYLANIVMNSGKNFKDDVKSFVYDTNKAHGNAVLENNKTYLKDYNFRSLVFPIGKSFLKTIDSSNTEYVFRKYEEITANSTGGFSLTTSGNEIFPYGLNSTLNSDQLKDVIITYSTNGGIETATSGSTDASGTVLSIDTAASLSPDTPIVVSYNVKNTNVKPKGKDLVTAYFRIDPSANTNGTYYLGWPDVYKIEGIWKGANSTFDENDSVDEVTGKFKLKVNVSETKYGISYIKKKNNFTIETTDRFLVKAKVFKKNTSGAFSQSFFSVDSYPVDDITSVLPDNKIRTEDIPAILRDSIDFRPHVANTAAYANTAASANTWTNSNRYDTETFEDIEYKISAPNKILETSYSYYLGRRDRIFVNENGKIIPIAGVSEETPTFPNVPKRGMTLAELYVPPFPTLPSYIANRKGKPAYGVSFNVKDNKRYTMRDIAKIDERINRIEYYTVLNSLEKDAKDMVIQGSDGLDRFKNGILADPFENFYAMDSRNDDFRASLDFGYKELSPSFRSYPIPLKLLTSSNCHVGNNTLTLAFEERSLIDQKYATFKRNCVTDFYNYNGRVYLNPSYDFAPDYTVSPDVNIEIDVAAPFIEFSDKLNEIMPLTFTNNYEIENEGFDSPYWTNGANSDYSDFGKLGELQSGGTNIFDTDTKTITNLKITKDLVVTNGELNTTRVGDFVTDIRFSPFMRSKSIEIFGYGLRPNTKVHFFFDGVNVDEYISSGTPSFDSPSNGFGIKTIARTSSIGAEIRSDSKGRVYAVLDLPANTFYVGDRELIISDVDNTRDLLSATTIAKSVYRAFNFSADKAGLEIATRMPYFDWNTTIEKTIITETPTYEDVPYDDGFSGGGWMDGYYGADDGFNSVPGTGPESSWGCSGDDPISQTFFVKKDYTNDNAVFVSSVDVYFAEKSDIAGITLEIRDTVNGYPGRKVIPFTTVRLESSDITVSDDASVATSFVFESPIPLIAGKEYTIVVKPDGNDPDYRIWVSKTGEIDVTTGVSINKDPNSGVLFTSTNNRTWKPYMDENLKFSIKRAFFNKKTGLAQLTNDNNEFLKLSSYSGNFKNGAYVFIEKTADTGNVAITAANTLVIGTGTTFTSYNIGNKFAYKTDVNEYGIGEITSIANNTHMYITPPPLNSNTNVTEFYKTSLGNVDYFNNLDPVMLHLSDSSVSSNSEIFSANDVIRTIDGSIAVVEEVRNLPISYIQSNIYKSNFTHTLTRIFANTLSNGVSNYLTTKLPFTFKKNTYFSNPTYIKSRSNEILDNGGTNSLVLDIDLVNRQIDKIGDTSPVIDHNICSITGYEFFIEGSNTAIVESESSNEGLAKARYLSKRVQLAENFDAEDMKIWLTAYKPSQTQIDVYVKFKSATDPTLDDEMTWTKMNLADEYNFYSSDANRFDFKEFVYDLGNTTLGAGEGAYLDRSNNDLFTYTSADGVIYNDYKFFTVKVVMYSGSHAKIPRLKDIRAIALT